MKKIGSVVFFAILIITVLFSSCNVARGEADVSAYFTENYLIAGVNGKDFSETIEKDSGIYQKQFHRFTIQLVGGEFKNIAVTQDVSEWIYPVENRVPGITWTVESFTPESVTIVVRGKPTLNQADRLEDNVSVIIPAVFIKGRVTSVPVTGENKIALKLYSPHDRVAFALKSLYTVSANAESGGTVGATVQLYGDGTAFKDIPSNTDISSWYGNSLSKGLTTRVATDIELGTTRLLSSFGVNSDTSKDKVLLAPTNGPKCMNLTIPKEYLTDGDTKGDLPVVSYFYINTKSSIFAYISNDVVIKGKVSTSDSDTIEPQDIIVNIALGKFKKPASADVTSWFKNAPNGLKFTLKNYDTINGVNQAIVVVTGCPTTESNESIRIEIPSSAITFTNTDDSAQRLAVDSRNAYYNIEKGDFYSWNMYDLASFQAPLGIGNGYMTPSINKNMTKDKDGNDLSFDENNNNRFAYGTTKEVKFEKGLSRRGYRLKGFSVQMPLLDAQSSSRTYKDYAFDENVDYTCTGDNISFTLKDEHKGQNINLFAIWEPDGTYFKDVFDITVTKEMIDAANPTDKAKAQLSNLKHHDGTALEKDYKQVFSFISLPAGRIGGTDETPEYFKWLAYWEGVGKGPSGTVIKNDFAIADIPLTAALWNVVYAWATSEERLNDIGEQYNFREDTASSGYPRAGVKNTLKADGTVDYVSRQSVEDPLSHLNWYTSLIFANALTEWYNATQNPGAQLTIAYTEDGTSNGKVLRDATQTEILDKITSGVNPGTEPSSGLTHVDGSTGFRLPTFPEMSYASSVIPSLPSPTMNNGSIAPNQVVSYPFAQNLGVPSGYFTYNRYDVKVRDYAVYSDLYRYTDDFGTQAVGKYFKADTIRKNGAKPNTIGLYDMTGNLWSWVADWRSNGDSNKYRIIFGGSWDQPYNSCGSFGNIKQPNMVSLSGVRYCRSL